MQKNNGEFFTRNNFLCKKMSLVCMVKKMGGCMVDNVEGPGGISSGEVQLTNEPLRTAVVEKPDREVQGSECEPRRRRVSPFELREHGLYS